jgi:UPF0271 protein
MTLTVDLNCDVGELPGKDGLMVDGRLLELVTTANVACGVHAGDIERMKAVAEICSRLRVKFGAHPGYPDRDGFGRSDVSMAPNQIRDLVFQQVESAMDVAAGVGIAMSHVKLHGTLYHNACDDPAIAEVIVAVVRQIDPELILIGRSGSELIRIGSEGSLTTINEAFADRSYRSDGRLVSRDHPRALIRDSGQIAERVLRMIQHHRVQTENGDDVVVCPETVCVHGDSPDALQTLQEIRRHLERNGVLIRGFRVGQ